MLREPRQVSLITLFSVIAEAPVRSPLPMWGQSDILTKHQLDRTEGLRYAEMPRLIEQVDPETGEVVIGEDGEPVMDSSDVRLSWIDATALTTVLGLAILSYAFSTFARVVGLALRGLGPWSPKSASGSRVRGSGMRIGPV